MKFGFLLGAAALLTLPAIPASAGVEFGKPDFPNYLSRPGAVSCDWQYDNYYRACPDPETPPKVVEKTKTKNKKTSKAN